MVSKRLQILCAASFLAALSFIIMLVEIPSPFLPIYKYDLADVPALIGTFTLGPAAGLGVVFVRNVLHNFIFKPDIIGHLMNFLASGSFVLAAGLIYMRVHTRAGAKWALAGGVVAQTLIMIPTNLIVLPAYMGLELSKAIELTIYATVPFNVTRGIINAIATYLLYKKVSPRLPHYLNIRKFSDYEGK
jgi:riboflavin transporter FmnP